MPIFIYGPPQFAFGPPTYGGAKQKVGGAKKKFLRFAQILLFWPPHFSKRAAATVYSVTSRLVYKMDIFCNLWISLVLI